MHALESTPLKHKHIIFPPACSYSFILKLCLVAGRAGTWEQTSHNNTVCTVPQSVRYHKLPPPRVLRVCYLPGQATWRVGSNIYAWNVFGPSPFTGGGLTESWCGHQSIILVMTVGLIHLYTPASGIARSSRLSIPYKGNRYGQPFPASIRVQMTSPSPQPSLSIKLGCTRRSAPAL